MTGDLTEVIRFALERLHLLAEGRLANEAILLFGNDPQRFFPDLQTDRRKSVSKCEGARAAIKQNISKAANLDVYQTGREDVEK